MLTLLLVSPAERVVADLVMRRVEERCRRRE